MKKNICLIIALMLFVGTVCGCSQQCNHDYVLSEQQLPVDGQNGYEKYTCTKCGNEYKKLLLNSTNEVSPTDSSSIEVSPPSMTPIVSELPVVNNFKEDDLYFEANGQKFTLKLSQGAFVSRMEAAGFTNPEVRDNGTVFGAGIDTIYSEENGKGQICVFSFQMYKCDPEDYTIEGIYVSTSTAVFKGGIKVGSTKDDVISVFGERYFDNGDNCICYNRSGSPKKFQEESYICFTFAGKRVVEIDMEANHKHK